MRFRELQKITSEYYPAISMDNLFPLFSRNKIKTISVLLTILLFLIIVISNIIQIQYIKYIEFGFFILLSISLKLISIDAYFYSFYLKDLEPILKENYNPSKRGSFLLSKTLINTNKGDLIKSFLLSKTGKEISLRLGISKDDISNFIKNRMAVLDENQINIDDNTENIFLSYIEELYDKNKDFSDFLFKFSIIKEDLLSTAKWISDREDLIKRNKRWWSKDTLSKNRPIGSDWSYGKIYKLEKYGNRIEEIYDITQSQIPKSYEKQLDELESSLEKNEEANIIIVNDDSILKMDLVIALQKKIFAGNVLTRLKNKVMIVLDINALIGSSVNKVNFENELISILNEAVKAGDVILVIPDMPSFILSSRSIGSDVISIIDPYLSNTSIQIIAMSDNVNFHQIMENNISMMERFEILKIEDERDDSITDLLLGRANLLEGNYGVFFTYKSIKSIKDASFRFFIGQIQSDKAIDLLEELPSYVIKKGRRVITQKDAEDLVSIKTGIPTGEVKEEEREKILNIENLLGQRIIGQDEAIFAISDAIKRSRSGVESNQKPIGSFLFLGPTGVGKTETTKALAEIFFGNKDDIVRLDMSEFSGADSIERLIGSFEINKIGVLTSKLKENPYSVLLLDEFEKSSKDVHDLFLQILDEGVFSDMLGKKVNVRNMIIIATSNAGSEDIWNIVKENKNLKDYKNQIIERIINNGIFRPELLNRFDDIILFNPLSRDILKKIVILMLQKLSERLLAKSLKLEINDDIVEFLVEKGTDPKFGARVINRAIQDNIEKIIADKIIKGEIRKGETIRITREELNQN